MLKALELVGFKSFADSTRFEFPRGITVVVGPNGSGKSNVVDAIKWVLGEQSVKSLRGKEMADVIFNGSHGPHRAERCRNHADVRQLRPSAGHRHARSSRHPPRLSQRRRRIPDQSPALPAARYSRSVCRHRRRHRSLQHHRARQSRCAAPVVAKDRRAIFEEAAGISRFKAKKIEALRRLERVDQNLLRLHDIVDEVENRLKSVRAQAAKARRYKDYADRLQELRTQVGLADWRALGEKLAAVEDAATKLRDEITTESCCAAAAEQQSVELENQSASVEAEIQTAQSQLSDNRQRTATVESAIEHGRQSVVDLEDQTSRHRKQLQALSNRASDLVELWQATQTEVQVAEAKHRELGNQLADQQRALTALTAQLDQIRSENEERRATHLEQLRTSAALTSEISTLEGRLARTEEARQRSRDRLAELQSARERVQQDLVALAQRQQELIERRDERIAELQSARDDLVEARRQHAARQKELAGWREQLSGLAQRAPCSKNSKNGTKASTSVPKKCCNSPAKIQKVPSNKCAACWPTWCK